MYTYIYTHDVRALWSTSPTIRRAQLYQKRVNTAFVYIYVIYIDMQEKSQNSTPT